MWNYEKLPQKQVPSWQSSASKTVGCQTENLALLGMKKEVAPRHWRPSHILWTQKEDEQMQRNKGIHIWNDINEWL